MKIMMKTLVGLILFSSLAGALAAPNPLPGSNLEIKPGMLQFRYQSFDGELSLSCTYSLENAASQDWKVLCSNERDHREYLVHLWVTRYTSTVEPKESYEVLYWITSPTPGASTTVWFKFKEATDLHSLQLALGLENETAELGVEITP